MKPPRIRGPFLPRGARGHDLVSFWLAVLTVHGVGLGAASCERRPPPIAAAPTGELAGVVVSETDKPLGGVSLELGHDPPDGRVPLATTRSDKSGAFHIARVPTGSFRLRAKSHEYLATALHIDIRLLEPSRVRLVLARGVPLAGTVEDERGAAVPLARILALPLADIEDAPPPAAATADAQGRFRIAELPQGAYRLLIEAPGLGTSAAGPVHLPDEGVRIVLSGVSRSVVGRVVRDGRGVAGARVMLAGEGLPGVRRGETDALGGFVFGGLGPGAYTLRAEVGGWVSTFVSEAIAERIAAVEKVKLVMLELTPAFFLTGRVIDEARAGVPRAQVLIDSIPATGLVEAPWTDAGGNWTSGPLPPGRYRFEARKPGFICRRTLGMQLGPGARDGATGSANGVPAPAVPTGGETRLELLRTGTLVGRIVDARGAPLRGARIRNRLARVEDLAVVFAPLPMAAEAAALPSARVFATAPGIRTTAGGGSAAGHDPQGESASGEVGGGEVSDGEVSDDDGRFRMTDVPPGHIRLEVVHVDSIPLRTAEITLAPGQTRDVGNIRLQGAVPLTGRVLEVEADGRAIPGALLTATAIASAGPVANTPAAAPAGSRPGAFDLFAVTDDTGAFSLPLPPGHFRVAVSATGRRTGAFAVDVGAAALPPAVTWRLSPAIETRTVVIDGVVKDAQGRPLAGATIALLDDSTDPRGPRDAPPTASSTRPARSDAGGHFHLEARLPGEVAAASLEIDHPLYPRVRQALSQSQVEGPQAHGPIEVRVPVPGAVRGEVHERVTGGPVARFQIEASGPDGAKSRYPDAAGSRRGRSRGADVFQFQLPKLSPGRWTLRVTAPGHEPLERIVDVPPAGAPGEFSVRDLRIELSPAP